MAFTSLLHFQYRTLLLIFLAGALTYNAYDDRRNIRVVNFDDVVNAEATKALQDERIAEYAYSQGVNHFTDRYTPLVASFSQLYLVNEGDQNNE